MRKLYLVAACLILSTSLLAGRLHAVTYTIKELPGLPDGKGGRGPQAINSKGQIAGMMRDADGNERVVIWDAKGNIRQLDSLPGHTVNWALDINDIGQVVGWSQDPDRRVRHAVLWDVHGKPHDLGTLGGDWSEATAINNKGCVVGHSHAKESKARAFLWTPGRGMVDLGALPDGMSFAEDIDDSGRIVGWSTDAEYKPHAVIWDLGGKMKDLTPILGLETGTLFAANGKGRIAGKEGAKCGKGNAFLWEAGKKPRDLGRLMNLPKFVGFIDPPPVPESCPTDINDSGHVVGWSSDERTHCHAFFWSAETGMIDLGTLPREKEREEDGARIVPGLDKLFEGQTWSEATGISNDGTIVGSSNGRPVIRTRVR